MEETKWEHGQGLRRKQEISPKHHRNEDNLERSTNKKTCSYHSNRHRG